MFTNSFCGLPPSHREITENMCVFLLAIHFPTLNEFCFPVITCLSHGYPPYPSPLVCVQLYYPIPSYFLGPFVADLTAIQLDNFEDALEVLAEGQRNRRTSQHALESLGFYCLNSLKVSLPLLFPLPPSKPRYPFQVNSTD